MRLNLRFVVEKQLLWSLRSLTLRFTILLVCFIHGLLMSFVLGFRKVYVWLHPQRAEDIAWVVTVSVALLRAWSWLCFALQRKESWPLLFRVFQVCLIHFIQSCVIVFNPNTRVVHGVLYSNSEHMPPFSVLWITVENISLCMCCKHRLYKQSVTFRATNSVLWSPSTVCMSLKEKCFVLAAQTVGLKAEFNACSLLWISKTTYTVFFE